MNTILLATSIEPFDLENQKKAVSSWLEAGFDVISCNIQEEIDQISHEFPQVNFVRMHRDGRLRFGKPYPYIYDILQALKDSEYDVCGIINSDIYIKGIQEYKGLIEYFIKMAKEGNCLFAHRLDVMDEQSMRLSKAAEWCSGIDVCIFNRNIIDCYCDDNFVIGRPVWDYWIMLLPYLYGFHVLDIKNYIFYHKKHAIRWNSEQQSQWVKEIDQKYLGGNQTFLTLFMKLFDSDSNAAYLAADSVTAVSVLIVFPNVDNGENALLSIGNQTHRNKRIHIGDIELKDVKEEYLFYASGFASYSPCMIDIVLHEMVFGHLDVVFLPSAHFAGGSSERRVNVCYRTSALSHGAAENAKTLLLPLHKINKKELLLSKTNTLEKVFIYPAGNIARVLIENVPGLLKKTIGFCDKNKMLHGKEVYGICIYPPDILSDVKSYDTILIASMQYENEIYEELNGFVPAEKLIRLSNLLNGSDVWDWI